VDIIVRSRTKAMEFSLVLFGRFLHNKLVMNNVLRVYN
jgi:hypothetical protein